MLFVYSGAASTTPGLSYEARWKDKNNIQFYLDGEPAGSVSTTRDFTRELNIIWDLWTIDQAWSGGIAKLEDLKNDSINTMKIDWIHTFKLVEDLSSSTGSLDQPSQEINIFPNPVSNHLNIQFASLPQSNAKIQIYDCEGKLVQSSVLSNKNTQLRLNQIPSNLYFLKIQNGQSILSKKILKN